ncbi:hypothetical protein [Sphingomonas sp. T9W2]|uniref:hypothetical protein n=1 Tax=Sphingomonas sp. T9W2 TaxID=3143183 RepID=UPI0031F4B39B
MDNIFSVSLVVVTFSLGAWSAGIYRQEPAMITGGIGIVGMLVSLLACVSADAKLTRSPTEI